MNRDISQLSEDEQAVLKANSAATHRLDVLLDDGDLLLAAWADDHAFVMGLEYATSAFAHYLTCPLKTEVVTVDGLLVHISYSAANLGDQDSLDPGVTK